ncbi:uncharacterized protein LOC121980886 [Zingiber officinale]|uniref:uncharacterized protein LOC121980886 n=1 Tax=Zingiber officinale TaxID=94328 RepID=UPI001C4CC6D2|nr:uncharacterized protein LOC121980886 [Zingiber officinale]
MICRSVCCGAMTFRAQDAEGVVVLVTGLGAEDAIGDYVRLGDADAGSRGSKWSSIWWWLRVVLLCVFLCAAAVPLVIFVGPLIIRKVIVPVLNWETRTFSRSVLVLLLFASIALFPTFLLPSSPCMWIAGMTFGYGYGFLLIMVGSLIGMSLPFFVGSFFRHDLHRWLEKWPKKAAIIRLAGEGDWFHQFRAVVLLRISPFPYLIFNYAAVAANIKYGPYISGSAVGTVHEIFITIYSGRLIQSLADATNTGVFLSMQQIVYDAIGFCVAAAATAAITIYAKRTLRTLQAEDELS